MQRWVIGLFSLVLLIIVGSLVTGLVGQGGKADTVALVAAGTTLLYLGYLWIRDWLE
jgi:hypothetical protein